MARTGRLIVITGPSGAGKSTITKEVLNRTGATLSVSATTRKPRPGEVDGRDYLFVDRPAFEKMIQAGELLEYAEVFGNFYGTPAGPVKEALAEGNNVILEIDVQGGLQVAKLMPEGRFVLILPPSDEELHRRLAGRGTESPEDVQRRFAKARAEIAAATGSGVYKYMVINDDLPTAVARVVEIVNQE